MRDRRDVQILHDDADIIAVNKPPGIAVIPGRDESRNLLHELSARLNHRLLVVHRLDKDTSGVLLYAKHTDAQRHLSHQFQNNTVRKQYLALVQGRVPERQGEIDEPIGVHPTNKKRMAVLKHGGRPARTAWQVEQLFRNHTLLRLFPHTGKTHQIRVHLAHIGFPLAIDPLYGRGSEGIFLSHFKRGYRVKRGEAEKPLIDRLPLHADRLRFVDLKGAEIEIASPMPKDLRVTLNMLAKYAS